MILGIRVDRCLGDDCIIVRIISKHRGVLEDLAEIARKRGIRDVYVSQIETTDLYVFEARVPKRRRQR